jgi:hypothetical protein
MLFWIFFVAICVMFYLVEFVEPLWAKPISRAMFIIFLIIITGFRYNIGTDYDSYVSWFFSLDWKYYEYIPEPFHMALTELLRFLGFDYQMLFFIYAALTYIVLFLAIKRYDLDPVLPIIICVFLFFWSLWTNQIRQGLAIVIILWGTPYIATRKFKKYILTVFFATMVHYSAIVLGIFYFFTHKHYFKWIHLLVVLTAAICSILDIVPKIMEFILSNETLIYVKYFDYDNHEERIRLGFLFRILLFMFIIYSRPYRKHKYENIIYNMYTLGLVGGFLFSFSAAVARIAHYFEIFFALAIPLYLSTINLQQKGIVALRSMITLYVVLTFFTSTYNTQTKWNPIYNPSATNIEYKVNIKLFK